MHPHRDRGLGRIRDLKAYLEHPDSLQDEIDALNELAWELRVSQPVESYAMSQKACELSRSAQFTEQLYARGLADGLVEQAFVDIYDGRLDTAVPKCLEALGLVSDSRSPTEVRVWFTLGWHSFFLGDYPTALENALKALNLSRVLGDHLHEAWSLDAVASFHSITGDFEHAIALHEDALKIFRELHDSIGELRTLNNLAISLNEYMQYEQALEVGNLGLQLARLHQLEMDVSNNSCTVADILLNMGRLEEAKKCLEEAMLGLDEPNISRGNILEVMGRVQLLQDDLEGAERLALAALNNAQKLDQIAEQARCCKTLSGIYEKQNQYPKALEFYKRYHDLSNMIRGEQVVKRMAALKVMYQVQNAYHEAEAYRLKSLKLQRKVDEQRRIQNSLVILSTMDALTSLYNRRYFDEVLKKEYARHSRSGAELSLLLLDVDHFKAYNDTYGHLSGDRCLQQIGVEIGNSIRRPPDVAARYGGEEFVCLLPETDLEGATKVAELIRQTIMKLEIPHAGSQTSSVITISIGVITAKCSKRGSPTELIVQADQQLYTAKSSGRNQVRADRLKPTRA